MRKMLGIAGILLILFSGCSERTATVQSPDYSESWEMVKELTIEQNMRMGAFLNEEYGITGGHFGAGRVHLTTDGGESWEFQQESGGCIYGVEIVDEETLWVAGQATGVSFNTPGGIRLIENWGEIWHESTVIPFVPQESPMSFLDDSQGWVFQLNYLYQTLDGGEITEKLTLPEGTERVKSLQMMAANRGFILDGQGRLHYTSNGGVRWRTLELLTGGLAGQELITLEGVTSDILFETEDKGSVVMALKGSNGPKVYMLHTQDGGANWQAEILCDGMGTVFISPDGRYITLGYEDSLTLYRRDA